jgi:DNA-binding transcriptional regulator YdaS (Cro superfamily)
MNKSKAIKTFGTASDLARVLGCTPSAIFQWPEVLPLRIADRVLAACVRKGIDPSPLLEAESAEGEA